MTTATGDISRDYSVQANANPWVDADFTARNSMTPIIASNALKSNFNSAGFYSYTAALPDQNSWESKGETVNAAATFGDQVGCGGITSAGNGYILWVNGNQWRIYKVTAFALSQLGGTDNISHSALDVIGLKYSFAGGTATLTATRNGVDTALLRTDSTSPYNGGIELTWYFNFDNNNSGGFRSIAADGIAVGPAITEINSGSGIIAGSTGNNYAVSGFTNPPTGLTVGGLAMLDHAGSGPFTFTDPFFVNDQVDPGFGSLSAVASNGSETSSGFSVTRTLPASWSSIVLAALSTADDSVAVQVSSVLGSITGWTLYWEPGEGGFVFYDDSTYANAPGGSKTIWLRDTDDVMHEGTMINGELVSVGGVGLTSRNITATGLTSRSITMRRITSG